MRKFFVLSLLLTWLAAGANERVIDISGNNTSTSYKSYSQSFSITAADVVNVKMARYCYFSSTITGSGTLNLYAGGERCYLGTEKGAAWPNWTNYRGDIHIFPFNENAPSAGFFGVVLAHGGKSFSPENVEEAVRSGKVNPSMQNNKVTLHNGATMCCEANSAGAGFRIGELWMEEGSSIIGYMKKNTRAAYFLVGCMGTDATLAGTIAPPEYSDTHPLGIIKEGRGTYRITGNKNYLSAGLRVLEGRVQIANDRAEAEQRRLRGALGARPNATEPIAYVFEQGVLGGTGSVGGTVDNYGTVEPGDYRREGDTEENTTGTLTLRNYSLPSKQANLVLHPASKLRFKVAGATDYDHLDVSGEVRFSNMTQDFGTSTGMPVIEITAVGELEGMEAGDEITLLTAKSKATAGGDWHFELKQPGKYTWELVEQASGSTYSVVLRLVSLKDPDSPDDPDNPDDPQTPESTMGAFYNDGIDDNADTHTLRYYADKNNKHIGVAISSWKGNMEEGGVQFNMLVAENEMKMETLQPQHGQFSFGSADNLVSFAERNCMAVRGHCLVWHQQQPTWLSSDGKKNDKNWTRQEALEIMKNHITTVMTRYKGKVSGWDVVNECLDDDQSVIRTNPDAYTLRQTVWQRAIGDDYIDSAFVYARRADPTAQLFLNDYGVELQGKAKSVAFRNMVRHLLQRHIPLDGVGLQCHFSVGDVDSVKLENTIRQFGEDGLKCIITELDIGISSTSSDNLEEQARNYRVVTDIVLNNDNCPDMVIWGLKDNDSWRSSSSPLLYTSSLGKKPAWYAVRSALRHRTLTPGPSVITGIQTYMTPDEQPVYDLMGRRLTGSVLSPGIYIIKGKKVKR